MNVGNFLSNLLFGIGAKTLQVAKAAEDLPRLTPSNFKEVGKKFLERSRHTHVEINRVDSPEDLRKVYGKDAIIAQGEDGKIYVSKKLSAAYNPKSKVYQLGEDFYEEGDIIWNDLGRDGAFSANLYLEENPELSPIALRYINYKEARLPLERDFIRVYREAPSRGCPTYPIVCRHGHFNIFVQDFQDPHGEIFYLVKLFNIMPCDSSSPRLYGTLFVEVDNASTTLFFRYRAGCSIDWDKEVADERREVELQYEQAKEMYKMGAGPDPDWDPYRVIADPLDIPPEETSPPETEET